MESLIDITLPAYVLFISVAALAWLWEDAAVITGALLAVEQKLTIPMGFLAAFIGIVSSDLALFGVGRLANKWRRIRGWLYLKPSVRRISQRLKKRTFSNILLIRFVPGLRTIGFTLCGVWRVPFFRFIGAMTFAGVLWVAVVFWGVYQVGSAEWFVDSNWKWSLMLIALAVLVLNNVWLSRKP